MLLLVITCVFLAAGNQTRAAVFGVATIVLSIPAVRGEWYKPSTEARPVQARVPPRATA